eukprot:767128-Hanusia_phi.AAC.3
MPARRPRCGAGARRRVESEPGLATPVTGAGFHRDSRGSDSDPESLGDSPAWAGAGTVLRYLPSPGRAPGPGGVTSVTRISD